MKNLIQARDILKYANIALPAAACNFRSLGHIEEYEFRHTLGLTFREVLLDQMEDYTAKPYFQVGTTYALDDVVKYQNGEVVEYYKANESTNTVPSDVTKWKVAPIFKAGDCQDKYTKVFCDYVAPWLSLSVAIKKVPFVHTMISDRGLIQYQGGEYATAEPEQRNFVIKALESERLIVFSNMLAYLIANKADACFSSIKFIEEGGCCYVQKNTVHERYRRYQYKIG
jgi:hypothetical protein